jgi:hypothetical protein
MEGMEEGQGAGPRRLRKRWRRPRHLPPLTAETGTKQIQVGPSLGADLTELQLQHRKMEEGSLGGVD